MRPSARGSQRPLSFEFGLGLLLALTACGRTELDCPSRLVIASGGSGPSGGQSSYGNSTTGATSAMGGSSSIASGGTRVATGAPGCPEIIPGDGSSCNSGLTCAYVALDKGCCRETATAGCKQGHWQVGYTDCDCSAKGGASATAGAAATGGYAGSGGLVTTGGRGGNPGAFGCRGDPMNSLARSCDMLIAAEPALVRLEGAPDARPSFMGLARATDDARCVSAVTTQSGSASESNRLVGLSFEPWSQWPLTGSLGPLTTIKLPNALAGAFVVGPSMDHRIALAFQTESAGLAFGWDLDAGTFEGSYKYLYRATPPLIIDTAPIGHLLASRGSLQQIARVWSADDTANTAFPGACADSATSFGVVPFKQGFLWATSNGSNNLDGACDYSTATPGPAMRMEIGQITDVCCSHSIWNFEFGRTIAQLKTAPHPEGIWIVWQAEDSAKRQFRWMRIGFEPDIVLGPASVDLDSDTPSDYAVAAIDRKLVVAWRNGTSEPRLAVALIDESGRVSRTDPVVNVPELRDLSMVSGPAGAGVLLGFADGSLMRLDCAEWE